ncbi:unnamed protein product [Effrenium voratum]|nr:unnamed protein product [Effrenium voratum]
MGDFGIAKVLNCTQAVACTAIGTPYYLSPEVCQEKPYAWPADIWAMGVILYELCALKLPFDGGPNMVVLVQSIIRGTAPALPEDYSPFVRSLCSEMLSKIPAKRPTAGAILSRPPMKRIVEGFFEEARAKVARDAAQPEAMVPALAPELEPPRPEKAPMACSTQLLDQMLNESDSTEASRAPVALSLEDECTELLAELGLDDGFAVPPAPPPPPAEPAEPTAPAEPAEPAASCADELADLAELAETAGSLTQAELDLLSSM